MALTVNPWLVWAALSLAVFGLVFLWRVARDAVRDVWEWWRRDRVTPLLDDEGDDGWIADYARITEEDDLEELPPERSWQEMTADQPIVVDRVTLWHDRGRERRAPWWEAEHRAAYESLGFDYPSGLMARVRELTP